MLIDTSVIIAILEQEPGHEQFLQAIDDAADRYMSVVCYYEAAVRLYCRKQDRKVLTALDDLVTALGIHLEEFTEQDLEYTVEAYIRYGKGLHPAKLNLADCIVYALAGKMGESLLFQGNDFSQTDILSAL